MVSHARKKFEIKMNPNSAFEVDPLANYEYQTYGNCAPPPPNSNLGPYQTANEPYYNYHIKTEPYLFPRDCDNGHNNELSSNSTETKANVADNTSNFSISQLNEYPNDVKENTAENLNVNSPPVASKKIKKECKNGQRSNYMSEKIADSDFPFYGCAVCNISFKLLGDLDRHIATHKERITSYGLRIKNQIKRKKLRKEQKKLKKLMKVKKEKQVKIEIEIKPEDGYIGDTKVEDCKPEVDTCNYYQYPVAESKDKSIADVNQFGKKNQSECKENENIGKSKDKTLQPGDYNLEKMFKCFACQKQFTLSYYLKLHVRSHTDEKPYTCAECGQCFITASKLGRHNKRIHLAIRHQCRICYKYFSRFEYLTRHFDKKHPEDKLEGEPYDYNAILPYLKELEGQLAKPEPPAEPEPAPGSNLWDDWPAEQPPVSYVAEPCRVDGEPVIVAKPLDAGGAPESVEILVDAPNPQFEVEFEVKKEELEEDGAEGADSVKEESFSDEDYFPSDTWAASPKPAEPEPPPRAKRPRAEAPVSCHVCQKSMSSPSYLRVHMRTHTGERPFKCHVCGRGFITSSKMHRHALTHNGSWDDASQKVKQEIKTETEGEEVKKRKKRPKEEPGAEGESQPGRRRKRPHACDFCGKRFLHLETLQVHRRCHDGESPPLKCRFCLASLGDAAALEEHEKTHDGPRPYLCTLCGKGYKKRETMVYHRKQHSAEKQHLCGVCRRAFGSRAKLRQHAAAHRPGRYALRYECPVCAHLFNTQYHVKMHLATHQREGLIVEENRSEILAMVLQNARRIPKHPEAAQPDEAEAEGATDGRSRMCNICGQVFQQFQHLEEHLRSHGDRIALEEEDEVKKHVCQVCNKSFKLHYYLKLHSFTHTKEKPYICQQCGKGFITRGKLKRHLETHSGLKKHQCHICHKFFTRPSYLRIHVRTIHGTQDFNFRLEKYAPRLGQCSAEVS
ncbi:unnamed protein product, partial [Iphiclides podalirius]